MVDLTVVILTKNEEKNIAKCINSIIPIAKRIVIVDSGSTDNTIKIAKSYGAEIYTNSFVNYSKQSNWALDYTNISTKWIFRLDADEIVSEELSKEIVECLSICNNQVKGYFMRFRLIFMGRELKHGNVGNTYILRLFQNGFGRVEENEMDEHTVVEGLTKKLKNHIIHNDFKSLDHWINKHNWYSNREVEDYFNYKNKISKNTVKGKLLGNQTERKRWVKHNLYYKTPLMIRAPFYFFYRYLFKLGVLDGKEGLIFHFLQGYWYRLLVDAKILEANKNKKISN